MVTWKDFIKLGSKVDVSEVNDRSSKITPEQCCTLVYTSGTTGKPKGVMLSHDNITWNTKEPEDKQQLPPGMKAISYLPLSHAAALFLDIFVPITSAVHIHFALPTALKGTLMQTVLEVRPHFFFAVPRIWQKIYEKMRSFEN